MESLKEKLSSMESSMRKAVSWLVCMAILLAQLPQISLEVKAENVDYQVKDVTGQDFGTVTFKISDDEYTVVSCDNNENYKGVTYTLNKNEWSVSGKDDGILQNDVLLLSSIDGKKVTSIKSYALDDSEVMESIVIPESVNQLGTNVFWDCHCLQSVTFPDAVTEIPNYTCSCCYHLNRVKLPKNLTKIGEYAFEQCGVSDGAGGRWDLVVPSSVTEIGRCAFRDCDSLKSLSFDGIVTKVCTGAFHNCANLESVVFPSDVDSTGSVCTIDADAFSNCENLKSINLPGCSTRIGECAFEYSGLRTLTIPGGVTSLSDSMCYACSDLESVTIQGAVTTIGRYAFSGCDTLCEINILDGIETIGRCAFRDCRALKNMTIPCGLNKEVFNSSCVSPNDSFTAYTVYDDDEDGDVVLENGTFHRIHTRNTWRKYSDDDRGDTYFYECNCGHDKLEGKVCVEEVGTVGLQVTSGDSLNLKAQKTLADEDTDVIKLSWSSSDPGVAGVYTLSSDDTRAFLIANGPGVTTVVVSTAGEKNGPRTSFDVMVKGAGEIVNNGYPEHFIFTGDEVADPSTYFASNVRLGASAAEPDDGDSTEDMLSFNWYIGTNVDGECLSEGARPSKPGVYTLQVKLDPGENSDYTSDELAVVFDIVDVTVNGTVGQNGWYTGDVTVAAPQGYKIVCDGQEVGNVLVLSSEGCHDLKYQLKYGNGFLTCEKSLQINIGSSEPYLLIDVGGNIFDKFLDTIKFKRFFKNPMSVEITSSEENSKMEYLISDKFYSIENLPRSGWNDYEGIFDLPVNSKGVVYARSTDDAGDVVYASTDGFVIYSDSEVITTEFDYTKGSKTSQFIKVRTNGNTIREITDHEKSLQEGYENDYIISIDSTDPNVSIITFMGNYLETLAEGEHLLTLWYNPQGEVYVETVGNEIPASTQVKIKSKVDRSSWGEPKEINGIMHYIDANGKTSVEVPEEPGIVWLKAESDGTSAWYGFDNGTGDFESGSRAYVQWLSKNDPEYEKYLTQSDTLIKIGEEGENIWIFRVGVIRPNGERYSNLEETTNLFVQIGDDWNKDEVKGYYIGEADGESVDTTVTNGTCPEGEGLFGVMKLKHFSPYLIYDKLTENAVEKTESPHAEKTPTKVSEKVEPSPRKVDVSEEPDEDLDEYYELLRKLLEEIDEPEDVNEEKIPIKTTGDINSARSISALGVLILLSAAYLLLRKKKSSQF